MNDIAPHAENAQRLSGVGAVSDAALGATDFILLVDTSGSMEKHSTRFFGKTRLQEVAEDAERIALQAERYDDDGLTVIQFASHATVRDGVTADAVEDIFTEFSPGGGTNTDAALNLAIKKARNSAKNCVVVIFTDGGADNEKAVIATLRSAAREFGRPRIGFIFVRVGADPGAKAFLDVLDSGLGENLPDIVATVTAEEAETMSIGNLAWLAQNA